MKRKTKPIEKGAKNHKKVDKKPKKPITNQEGDPIINHLSDFVTAIHPIASHKPIYTGGKIHIHHNLLYATCNEEIMVYDVEAEQTHSIIKHINQQIVNFCVCPMNKLIATFSKSGMLRVLVLQSRKILHSAKMEGMFANSMEFSPNGLYLGIAFGGIVQIFTVQTMKRTHSYNPCRSKNRFIVTKLQWHPHPDALTIITTDLQKNIAVFDYILNKVIAQSQEGEGGSNFALSPNGQYIAALNKLEIKLYQTRSLHLQWKLQTQQYMQSICIVQGRIFVGGQDTPLYSCKLKTGQQTQQHNNCTENGIMKLLPSNNKLLLVSYEQNITFLTLDKTPKVEKILVCFNDQIIDIKYSKGEPTDYIVMVTNSNNVKVINRTNNKLMYMLQGHENTVLCCQFWYPYVMTGGKDNMMKLWKIEESQGRKGHVRLLANYLGHSGDVVSMCCMGRKTIVSVSDDKSLKIWPICEDALQTIQIKASLHSVYAHNKAINSVKVSKKGMIATCSQDRTIKLWNEELMNTMVLAGHRRGVWDAIFHDVEELLVSVAGDGMMKGWNFISGECLWSMGEGPALIRCSWLYYNQVVTGSLDGIIKIWDIRKQTSLSYDKHNGKIWALDVLTHEGKPIQIISGGTDSTYHIWVENTTNLRDQIMDRQENEEQEKVAYNRLMHEGKYCEAALTAFKNNYTQQFVDTLQIMTLKVNVKSAIIYENQKVQLQNSDKKWVEEDQFEQLVKNLATVDLQKLLVIVQTMNSTIKHYKLGNKILHLLLSRIPISQLNHLQKTLFLPEKSHSLSEFNEKKSDFEKWLQNMISSQHRHLNRLQNYIKGSIWDQHLYEKDNPLLH